MPPEFCRFWVLRKKFTRATRSFLFVRHAGCDCIELASFQYTAPGALSRGHCLHVILAQRSQHGMLRFLACGASVDDRNHCFDDATALFNVLDDLSSETSGHEDIREDNYATTL